MMPSNLTKDPVCRETQTLLSEYIDNTLSARQAWEVEKHLAACTDCQEFSHSLQRTVSLLQSSERQDTGDDFMARLHARLDGLEPEAQRAAPLTALRDWLAGVRDGLYVRRVPALSLGMASLAMALLLLVNHPTPPMVAPGESVVSRANAAAAGSQDHDALSRHVAVTASNPFDDPVAAKLEAEAANDTNGRSAVN